MKSSLVRIQVICLLVLLLTTSCQTAKKSFIPVTGDDASSAPAQVETARNKTVDYLISTGRLETAPPRVGWQLDTATSTEGEYHFSNGDWVLVIRSADDQKEDSLVILRNEATRTIWCGYVQPNGHVVDTSYLP